jgi:CTD kinase subunit beta
VKVCKDILGTSDEVKEFFQLAWDMSIDMYKTFVPLKQTAFAMCLTCVELTALITGKYVDEVRAVDPERFHVTRNSIMESLLDLLELYTQHHKSTKLGARFELEKWVELKIRVNEELESDPTLKRYEFWCDECEKETEKQGTNGYMPPATMSSVSSIRLSTRQSDTTVRFIFNPDQARAESNTVAEYFKDDYEEYEEEVEEPIPEPERPDGPRDRGHHGSMRGGRGGRHDGHGHGHGHGWSPYNRSHRPHHPHDRRGGRRYH